MINDIVTIAFLPMSMILISAIVFIKLTLPKNDDNSMYEIYQKSKGDMKWI